MDSIKMDFNKAAESVEEFIENDLTQKLAAIYEQTGVMPADMFELLKERLDDNGGFDVVTKANRLTREGKNERATN